MNGEKTAKLWGQLFFIIVIVMVCALISCPPEQRPIFQKELAGYKVNYGLDLKGGSELVYEVNPKDIDPARGAEEVIGDTTAIISERIDNSGIVKDPRVQRQGENRILVQLPGLNRIDTEEIKKVISMLGNLELRLVATAEVGKQINEDQERAKYEERKKEARTRQGAAALKLYEENLLKKGYRWFPSKEGGPDRLLWIKDSYDIVGKKFSSVHYESLSGDIVFELREEAHRDFGRMTKKYQGQFLAILFNNQVVAAPKIQSPIPEGRGVLQNFTADDAKSLTKILRSGSLEIQPEIVHENTIGPSLGEDSIRIGITAGVLGLAFTIIFMTIYYLVGGFISGLALLVNLVMVGAIVVLFRETLTLPGIAGLLLSVVMSIDANIIIFERIREEKAKKQEDAAAFHKQEGSTGPVRKNFTKQELLDCVNVGYSQAFWTIFDSNVTTLLTAGILYWIASGPIESFAFTMGWGIVVSFFTAIFVTRVMLTLGINLGLIRSLSMLQLFRKANVPFIGTMRPAMIMSLLLIVLGTAFFYSRGEQNYGLDFKGGVLAHMSLEKPLTTQEVRTRLSDFQVEVQHIVSKYKQGSESTGWYEFSVRLPNLNQEKIEEKNAELAKLSESIRNKYKILRDQEGLKIRMEEEKSEVVRQIARIDKNDPAMRERLESLRAERDNFNRRIEDLDKEVIKLQKEIDEVRSQRNKGVAEKNELAGVEKLRLAINEKFKNELSPTGFGKMTPVDKDRFRNYVELPVYLQTPASPEFLQTLFPTDRDGTEYKDALFALSSYRLSFKAPADMTTEQATEELKKHLYSATPRLTPQPFEIKGEGGTMSTVLTFDTTIPFKVVEEALERSPFTERKLRASAQDNKVTEFSLYLSLPTERTAEPMEKQQNYAENLVRTKLEDQEEGGNKIFLSDPFPSFTQISGVVAQSQKVKAYRAIILSLIVLMVYIAFRFPNGWRFGFAASLSLAHNVLLTLGAIAIADHFNIVNMEIDLTVIAALLTLVGYSLNDTIVIFDRIRENQKKEEQWDRLSIEQVSSMMNTALNQTLSRTVLTASTTIFMLLVMFILNRNTGSVLEGFSFTLIFGIIVGTYSSIFVASALVLYLEKRERLKAKTA